ncbi:MAG: hypothetical protein QOH83_11 [Solirubrobacteraceae bacterium]|jgi:hypothetical protein|nr:hypothetical protein [Solirubrobacteraceae bacterium]
MKLRRPSPALVISFTALVVASTGTAIAATVITSSSQIKNGAVQSADIKDGSVQGRDIKDGTITANKLKTPPGAAAGASTAYQALRKSGPEAQPANQLIRVATLTVPAGAYAVSAETVMTALPGPQNPIQALIQDNIAIGGRCILNAAGEATESLQNVVINQRQTPATFAMQTTRTVAGPSDFTLDCTAGMPWRLSETSIVATKASDIVLTNIP